MCRDFTRFEECGNMKDRSTGLREKAGELVPEAGGALEGCLSIEFLLQNRPKKKKSRCLLPGSGLSSFSFSLNPREAPLWG
jgi:hypothetical protein